MPRARRDIREDPSGDQEAWCPFPRRRPRRRLRWVLPLSIGVALPVLVAGLFWAVPLLLPNRTTSRQPDRADTENALVPVEILEESVSLDGMDTDVQSIWDKVRPSVVHIRTERGHGSGFVLEDGLVVTNHHVVVGAHRVTVDFQDGTSTDVADFAAADAKKDVAVLKVDTKGKATNLALARTLPSVGDKVVAISNFARSDGRITRIDSEETTWIETTAKSDFGFSGGPLLNCEGEVLGVMARGGPDAKHTLAVAAEEIRELLTSSRYSHHSLPVPGTAIQVGKVVGSSRHGVFLPREKSALVVISSASEIRDCGAHGVYVQGHHNTVTVRAGLVQGNRGHGIVVLGDKNTIRISGGEIKDNEGNGVLVRGDGNTVCIFTCTISRNRRYAIEIEGEDNTLEISGGMILGDNGDDISITGEGSRWSITGGGFGDDGGSRDGQPRTVGYKAKQAYLRGLEFYREGKSDEAIDCLCEAIRQNPQFANAYHLRGVVRSLADENGRAIVDFVEAIRINPQLAIAYSSRGDTYVKIGEFDKAIDDFTQAVHLKRWFFDVCHAYRQRMRCYLETGDNPKAIDDFLESKRLGLETMAPYAWWSEFYDEAIRDVTAEIGQGKGVADHFRKRGMLYYKKGELEKAIEDWTTAIDLDPDEGGLYVLRSLAHKKKRDDVKAAADWEKAKELAKKLFENLQEQPDTEATE